MNDGHKAKYSIEKDADRGVGLLDEAKERISNLADDAKDRGEKLVGQVKDRGSEVWDQAQEKGQSALKGVQRRIEKHPWKAMGYAIAAGAALLALFGRKKKEKS